MHWLYSLVLFIAFILYTPVYFYRTRLRRGERLYLSEKTVKHYMTNILQKLHVRNRLEAVLLAQKSGQERFGTEPRENTNKK